MKNAPIRLSIKQEDLLALEGMLLKWRAGELSDLRRVQTQLTAYGDRRASMEGEPAAIEARLELLTDLLSQLEKQR